MRIAILGAGPGGYVAALKAAQLGAQVTVIEDTEVGGTCLNRGCIPTKALVASAEAYSKAKGLEEFGIELRGELIPNLHKINERKNKVVSIQVKGIKGLFKSWGVTLKEGRGALLSQKEIEVRGKDSSTEKIEADKIIIATGSRPAQIPSFIFDGKKILSSDDALNLTEIPKSMLIIGAGVIGCEFACIYKELGADVTMVEMMPRAVVTEDMEISGLLEKELKKKKIKLHTNVKVEKVEVKEDGVHAFMSDGKEIITEKMETNVPDIYAIGDVTGGMLLAHTASTQGIVTAKNIMGHNEKMDYGTVPAAIFTSPEIASVGLREHQAEEKGLKIRTGHFQFRGLGKAHAMGEIAGFIKVIADEATDKLLGMHIIGPHASDLIHEGAVAIKAGLKVRDIANTIHAHPTLSEGIMEASEDVHNEAVHIPPKK